MRKIPKIKEFLRNSLITWKELRFPGKNISSFLFLGIHRDQKSGNPPTLITNLVCQSQFN